MCNAYENEKRRQQEAGVEFLPSGTSWNIMHVDFFAGESDNPVRARMNDPPGMPNLLGQNGNLICIAFFIKLCLGKEHTHGTRYDPNK
jgi:hypothetical protein